MWPNLLLQVVKTKASKHCPTGLNSGYFMTILAGLTELDQCFGENRWGDLYHVLAKIKIADEQSYSPKRTCCLLDQIANFGLVMQHIKV